LIAAIDDQLRDDFETGTQSSWQTMQNPISTPRAPTTRVQGKKLTRARGPSIEFCLSGLNAELNNYSGASVVSSRTFVTVRDLEILDHIKTSTWKKFLTSLRSDSKGNIRETDANMVRIELQSVLPAPGHKSEEARLRVSGLTGFNPPLLTPLSFRRRFYLSAYMSTKMQSTS
jgi:autophagy-related protein 2